MAPRRVRVNKNDQKKLSGNDVICPLCRSILIKPITLPCSHGFCSSCFETTTQNANVVCPLCRVRVGSWLRSASKSKKLINEALWLSIQNLFPLQVKNKLNKIGENHADTFTASQLNNSQNQLSRRNRGKIDNLNLIKMKTKQPEQLHSNSSSSTYLSKSGGVGTTVPENRGQTSLVTTEQNLKCPNFIKNFATKEYTCRILCQDVSSKDKQKNLFKESLMLKKNKRIQEITDSEISNDRSNSIESECLYFKPIDYRHNPPSKGLTPIKVPTRKPNVSPHMKILAPSGQNQININHLASAFARLCSAVVQESIKNANTIVEEEQNVSKTALKRKHSKFENKGTKKVKASHKTLQNYSLKSQGCLNTTLTNVCDTTSSDFYPPVTNPSDVKRTANFKQGTNRLISENIKRALQEQADFELATKLQQTYNQSSKYSTRSSVLKSMASKNQVKMEGMITSYKVK